MLSHEHEGGQAAVSPVKATAVMVAVAVVGGILVFAASQWFFGQPSAGEEFAITGYDSTDGSCLHDHEGSAIPICNDDNDGMLTTGDAVAIYVHNAGSGPLEVTMVEIAGVIHFLDSSGQPDPVVGSFAVLGSQESSVGAGDSRTIIVRYGGAGVGNGSVMTVAVEAGDKVSSAPVIIGEKSTS